MNPKIYDLFIENPQSDLEKKIEGKIIISFTGPKSSAIGELSGFQNSKTIKVGPTQPSFTSELNIIVDEVIIMLIDQIQSEYNVDLTGRLKSFGPVIVEPTVVKQTKIANSDEVAISTKMESSIIVLNDIIFSIDTNGNIKNDKLGDLKIIEKVDTSILTGFDFDDLEVDNSLLGDEFIEEYFSGTEEEGLLINDSNNIFYKDSSMVENAIEDLSNTGTESIFFNGREFTGVVKGKNYSSKYNLYIDFRKMPKPKITKQILIETKLKVEGGRTGNPKDSAAKSGYCPTKWNDGNLYHTNKGITYAVWKKIFGSGNDKRFLDMNLDDWRRVFDESFWNKNATSKYESVNCLLVSFAWGGNKPKTVENAIKLLGNRSLDSVSEEEAVAALLSSRAQFFINISQPNNKNNTFRKGWINAINEFTKKTYF
jgi:hypothetical protein